MPSTTEKREQLLAQIKQKEFEMRETALLQAISRFDIDIMKAEAEIERLSAEKEKSSAALEEYRKQAREKPYGGTDTKNEDSDS
jgi:predicted secreted acid phosphatase